MDARRALPVLAGLWVVAVLAAYMLQFREIMPVLLALWFHR